MKGGDHRSDLVVAWCISFVNVEVYLLGSIIPWIEVEELALYDLS